MAYTIGFGGFGSTSPGEALRTGWPMGVRAQMRATSSASQRSALQNLTSNTKPAVAPGMAAGVRARPNMQAKPMVPARLGPLKQPVANPKPNPTAMLARLKAQPQKSVVELENRGVNSAMQLAAMRSAMSR